MLTSLICLFIYQVSSFSLFHSLPPITFFFFISCVTPSATIITLPSAFLQLFSHISLFINAQLLPLAHRRHFVIITPAAAPRRHSRHVIAATDQTFYATVLSRLSSLIFFVTLAQAVTPPPRHHYATHRFSLNTPVHYFFDNIDRAEGSISPRHFITHWHW